MRSITTVHYVPKPGGGVATPGEVLEPEIAARFTDAQIARLLKAGAILVEDVPELDAPEQFETESKETGEESEVRAEDAELDCDADEPEPPEVDTLDGIVRAEESHEEQPRKPKASATRAGRRKTK